MVECSTHVHDLIDRTDAFYPPEGFGAPKDRVASGAGPVGLPPGTQVFSADDHISLAEDIFYERLPASMREKAPRIWYRDGAFELGAMDTSFLPPQFSHVLMQYDPLAGVEHRGPGRAA